MAAWPQKATGQFAEVLVSKRTKIFQINENRIFDRNLAHFSVHLRKMSGNLGETRGNSGNRNLGESRGNSGNLGETRGISGKLGESRVKSGKLGGNSGETWETQGNSPGILLERERP